MPDYDEDTDDWYRTIAKHSNRIKALETEVMRSRELLVSNELVVSLLTEQTKAIRDLRARVVELEQMNRREAA